MRRRLAVVVAGLAVLVGAVGCSGEDSDVPGAGQSAEAWAEDVLVDMTSYRHDALEEDFAWMSSHLSAELEASIAAWSESLKTFVSDTELVVTGEVVDLVHREDPDGVVVFALVHQEMYSEELDEVVSSSDVLVRMLLEPDGDGWLVSRLNVGDTVVDD
jgi:hypothetical protein